MTADLAQLAVPTVAGDDLDLVHASKNGDVAAFEELVKRYDRKLFRIAQHVTHNREDSEDVVQETFLKAFQHLGEFREDSKVSTWLIRITLNQALTKLRKQRRAIREVSLEEDFQTGEDTLPMEVTDWAPNPEQLYRASELRDILIKALRELRPILRAVLVLRDVEGLSIAETAEVLNLSPAAVKARLWRGRLQLRERLNRYFRKETESARVELSPKNNTAEELRLRGAASESNGAKTRSWSLASSGISANFIQRSWDPLSSSRRLPGLSRSNGQGVSEDNDS
jgi:RNA polymerase sigma-70 factor (ECF subfamily)